MDALRFTAEQYVKLQDYFLQYDTNKDGTISGDEIGPLMEALGLKTSKKHIRTFMKTVDTDSNNSIDFGEFLSMIAARTKMEHYRKMFERIDKDGNGYLTVEELRQGLKELNENVTEADIANYIRNADSNGDGKIDYTEFAISMTISSS